ncbi:hypothetical protein SVTN_31265 [Streptomyces vietnamensis]|uniref:Uncharacterized protein n=1 Tax=Streptomyces vietnamensis TaxID=362257 RepID=A0A0B5I207_9ACTN|nr:hypothetical protein SVTN_31265 [Streptomyces vietnamensis]
MRECYWDELKEAQKRYALERESAAALHWERAEACIARLDLDGATDAFRLAHDPLPARRAALEWQEREIIKIHRESAVLVRPSAADNRSHFHRDPDCGLISGAGRKPHQASWMLLGDAQATGYYPCSRC